MTLRATFKAKPQELHCPEGIRLFVKVPELTRRHVDMHLARTHPRFGGYANSDLFPSMLRRCAAVPPGKVIYLDALPPGVAVDTSGFLAAVTLDVEWPQHAA